MYTNRKLSASQLAAEREKFYCDKAYEYTLRADSAEEIIKRYETILADLGKIRATYHFFPEKSALVVSVLGNNMFSIAITGEEAGCVSFVLCFRKWKSYVLKEPISAEKK